MSRRCLHHHLVWSLGAAVALSAMAWLPTACSHEWEELRFAGAATGGSTTGSTSTGGGGTGTGTVGGSGGQGATTTTSTGEQGGMGSCPDNSGECIDDHECDGGTCVALGECGYRVCVRDVPEANGCEHVGDECCESAECDEGHTCLELPVEPTCTGVSPQAYNQCLTAGCDPGDVSVCSTDDQICVPAGALGRKVGRCMDASCLQDADCTEESGGRCVPITPYCCDGPAGLHCLYSGGCATQADCDLYNMFCVVQAGGSLCVSDEPSCN